MTVFVGDRWNTIYILRPNLGQADQYRALGGSSGECELGGGGSQAKHAIAFQLKKKKVTGE